MTSDALAGPDCRPPGLSMSLLHTIPRYLRPPQFGIHGVQWLAFTATSPRARISSAERMISSAVSRHRHDARTHARVRPVPGVKLPRVSSRSVRAEPVRTSLSFRPRSREKRADIPGSRVTSPTAGINHLVLRTVGRLV